MPITLISRDYEDIFSNNLNYYQANAGDTQTVKFEVWENIRAYGNSVSSLSLDAGNDLITWISGNFLDEGFRVGDEVQITVFHSNGTVNHTYVSNILICNPNQIKVTAHTHWYNATAGETLLIEVNYKTGFKRKGLLLECNHVESGSTGNANSLIDGERTQFTFDLTGTTTGSVISGVQVGFFSGQFNAATSIEDLTTYPNNTRKYELTVGIIQSGVYDITPFLFSNCLKAFFGLNWEREVGNPNNRTRFVISEDANTGWFDEPFNAGVTDAVLVQGIPSLDYSAVNTGQIAIDSASTDFGFGACYIPTDPAYFNTQFNSQSVLGMLCPSQTSAAPITITSSTNPSGGQYTIEFSNPVTVGTVTTWDYEFTPNSDFTDFIDARIEGDRLFYVWAKYGTVNLLLFADQLTKPEPPAGAIEVLISQFVDHSENFGKPVINKTGYEANTEDDLAFLALIMIKFGDIITSINPSLEAYNSVTGESFNLFNANFDLTSVPIVAGKHQVNQSVLLNTELPTTSEKRSAKLFLSPSFDTVLKYAMNLSFPFLNDWRYWIALPGANADFYPSEQNRNYVPFDNTGNWGVRLNLSMIKNGLNFQFTNYLIIKDYDSDANIFQEIELYIESTAQNVQVIVDGELHRIIATHTNLDASAWDVSNIWGMITIEPTESSPRWICSTIIDIDGNTLNPLSPITGLTATLTFPTPDVAQIECFFDPGKINLTNGVKFTTKIKGCYV
jgi:hypothetical protein